MPLRSSRLHPAQSLRFHPSNALATPMTAAKKQALEATLNRQRGYFAARFGQPGMRPWRQAAQARRGVKAIAAAEGLGLSLAWQRRPERRNKGFFARGHACAGGGGHLGYAL